MYRINAVFLETRLSGWVWGTFMADLLVYNQRDYNVTQVFMLAIGVCGEIARSRLVVCICKYVYMYTCICIYSICTGICVLIYLLPLDPQLQQTHS